MRTAGWFLDEDGTDRWWWDGKPTPIARTWKVEVA